MMQHEYFLTVFTPVFNRAHTLPRTYESLRQQSCKDFVWLVINDGSTDSTEELVKAWQEQNNGFKIEYIYKENGGMHTAHNVAYANIRTELNVCIDSDDALATNAVQIIKEHWLEKREKGYAGMIGLDADFSGHLIGGKKFPEGLHNTTLTDYYKNGGAGDKKLVLRTEIVKKYPPYPTFSGEKFVPLGTLYTMIDADYELAVINDVLCYVEYMNDGSTKNMMRQYYLNPNGFRYSRLISLRSDLSFKRKYIIYSHYVAESMLAGENIFRDAPNKLELILSLPVGFALWGYIKVKNLQI